MDANRFDASIQSFADGLPRRAALGGALGTSLAVLLTSIGAGFAFLPTLVRIDEAEARRKRRKKKKIKRNAFGCVDVGTFCKNNGQCCSGICKGKKGKRKCKAHDASTCRGDQDACLEENAEDVTCVTSRGEEGFCFRTTGQASYCGDEDEGSCFVCATDADCVPFCGPGAACVICNSCVNDGGTACIGIAECTFPPDGD